MTLTFTFAGPDGQVIASHSGRVVVYVKHAWTRHLLEEAAYAFQPVTPTGPWSLGGGGMDDPESVFWAARMVLPHWTLTGDTPKVPHMSPPAPGILYAPS
ncbi:MAG: hypothetical protein ACK4WK_05635 [Anaerolineae bacterium]